MIVQSKAAMFDTIHQRVKIGEGRQADAHPRMTLTLAVGSR